MTARDQLAAWGVDLDALLNTEIEPLPVPPEGRRAGAWCEAFGREVRRRISMRGPLAERHAAERDELAARQALERQQLA